MLKNYKTLLFDIDNTLLDFSASEKVALQRLFEGQNFPLKPEVKARYQTINQGLWTAFEEGKIDRDEVMNTRFSILFKEYGLEVDGVSLEKSYHSYLKEGHQLINGALELIKDLQNQYNLYIVTNGDSETQYKRLHDSGLYPLFKDIFVSEDTGYQKPMKEYFDYVFERIPNLTVENTLIIGDSLSADIKGGEMAGIDTCWFNPEMIPNDTGILPTYEIQKLEEVYQVLNLEKAEVGR